MRPGGRLLSDMPIPVTETLDDGAYIDQATPVAGVPSGVPGFEMCLIGHGSRTKSINSEPIMRGQVLDETLTVATSSPYTATLANRATRNSNHTAVYANGAELDISQWSWVTPEVTGTADLSGPLDLDNSAAIAYPAIGISVDGLPSLTIVFEAGGTVGDINANSAQRQVVVVAGANLSSTTQADVVTAINAALHSALAVALGYDATHTYALASGNFLKITGKSGVASTVADVRILAPMTDSVNTTLFGSATASADSVVQIRDDVYSVYGASATYKIDYAKASSTADTPATSGVQSITSVGVRSGSADFVKDTDWQETSGTIDWSVDAAATLDSVAQAFDLQVSGSGTDTLKLGFDGLSPVEMDLYGKTGLGDPTAAGGVLGYANASSETAATAAEVANNVNALSAYYFGPEYRAVAASTAVSGVGTVVRLSSYVQGIAGVIEFEAPATPATDATSDIFGFTVASSDTYLADQGEGRVPDAGTVYYVNYTATRPAAEYNRRRLFRDAGLAQQELGTEGASNPLATCVQMAFDLGVGFLSVIQVNDASIEGSPTRSEFKTALFATERSDSITEIVPLTTSADTHIDLLELLAVRNSGQNGQYCRGYIGPAANTELGDVDQSGTLLYLGKRTYQVSDPSSPARGRLMGFLAPTQRALTRTVTTTENGTVSIPMTGYHYATIGAARRMTFTTPKTSLAKKTCNVFDTDIEDDELWSKSERVELKKAGWLVMRFNAGQFTFGSPVTFEFGRRTRIDEFAYDNTSPQKDNVYRTIIATLEENLEGAVPVSPTDFGLTMRSLIANAINSQIPSALANYESSDGTARPIDPQRDINIKRAVEEGGSRTRWLFSYSAFLAYPALSFVGTAFWDRALPAFGSISSSDLV